MRLSRRRKKRRYSSRNRFFFQYNRFKNVSNQKLLVCVRYGEIGLSVYSEYIYINIVWKIKNKIRKNEAETENDMFR